MTERIKSASFSRLSTYATCPKRAMLAYALKIPENQPPEGVETPMDRGSRLHQAIEDFLMKRNPQLSSEIINHRSYIENLAEKPELWIEEQLNFDDTWQILDSNDYEHTWFIMKTDVTYPINEDSAVFIDWKTGKKQRNEIKHGDQLLTYAIGLFIKYPKFEILTGHLKYIDNGESTTVKYRSHTMSGFRNALTERINIMLDDTEFLPKPSVWHCSYCPYKTGDIGKKPPIIKGTGDCNLNP